MTALGLTSKFENSKDAEYLTFHKMQRERKFHAHQDIGSSNKIGLCRQTEELNLIIGGATGCIQ